MEAKGALGGVVVSWDDKVLELIEVEVGAFSISSHFKNCEDSFKWLFTKVCDHVLREEREAF